MKFLMRIFTLGFPFRGNPLESEDKSLLGQGDEYFRSFYSMWFKKGGGEDAEDRPSNQV